MNCEEGVNCKHAHGSDENRIINDHNDTGDIGDTNKKRQATMQRRSLHSCQVVVGSLEAVVIGSLEAMISTPTKGAVRTADGNSAGAMEFLEGVWMMEAS